MILMVRLVGATVFTHAVFTTKASDQHVVAAHVALPHVTQQKVMIGADHGNPLSLLYNITQQFNYSTTQVEG